MTATNRVITFLSVFTTACFLGVVLCFSGTVTPGKDKTQKEKENKGLFGVFRKSKKQSDQVNVTQKKYLNFTNWDVAVSQSTLKSLEGGLFTLVCY